MKILEELHIIAFLLSALYFFVLLLVLADLWAGVRKAKQRGEVRTSYGYRQTVNKIAKYYNALFALTFIDLMQMSSAWYMDNYFEYQIPIFPVVTLLGSVGIGFIEVKSIFEKAENKIKNDCYQAALAISKIIGKNTDTEEITKTVIDYLKEKPKP